MEFLKSNLEWGKDLVEKYPLVLIEGSEYWKGVYKSDMIAEDFVNLRYGFECGQGWEKLIEEIADTGTQLVTDLRKCRGASKDEIFIRSCIVKEKFGTLRWQGCFSLPAPYGTLWSNFVSSIECKSAQTCEVTGGYGERRSRKGGKLAWVRTLCEEEAIKQGYDIEKSSEF